MRWIFIVLMAANVVLLAWQLLVGGIVGGNVADGNEPAPGSRPLPSQPSAPTILLLSEAGADVVGSRPPADVLVPETNAVQEPEQTAPGESPDPAAQQVPPISAERAPLEAAAEANALNERMCMFVGPYRAEDEAAQLVERLAAMGITGTVEELEVPAGPGYWVYIEPFGTRREALRRLAELQAQGVDSYIIPRGELMHGISLGMFSRENLADARVKEMADLGVQAKIDIIERSYKETWVSIPAAVAGRLGDQAWQRLLGPDESVNQRQNFCLDVASQDNIH